MGNWTGGGQYKKDSTLIIKIIMIGYDFVFLS